MALDISLKNFIDISAGKYNAGQVDFVEGKDGLELIKVNNHVFLKGSNTVKISQEHVLQIKEAFLHSISGKVSEDVAKEIADSLGMGDIDLTKRGVSVESAMRKRFEPLKRQQLRDIIVKYHLAGDSPQIIQDSQKVVRRREAINRELDTHAIALDDSLNDLLDILTMNNTLGNVLEKMLRRTEEQHGENMGYARQELLTTFAGEISKLFKTAVAMRENNEPSTAVLKLFDKDLQLTCNREDGMFSVKIGSGTTAFSVDFKATMQNVAEVLQAEIVKDKRGAFTASMGALLDIFFAKDITNGLTVTDRTSETRKFAAKIIAGKMKDNPADAVMNAAINTNFLVMLAKDVLDGKIPNLNLEALNERHAVLKQEMGGMDEETLRLLAIVAHVPLNFQENGKVQMTVSSDMVNAQGHQEGFQKPMTGDINKIASQAIPDSSVPKLQSSDAACKPEDIRDFVADMMYSADTLMAEVNLDLPGEHLRSFLMNPRNIDAFRAIMLDRSVLDTAVSPTLLQEAKACFDAMARLIDQEYQKKYGVTLANVDRNSADFKRNFAELLKTMDANVLATCDNRILLFTNAGTKSIQAFINTVFKLDEADDMKQAEGGDQAGVQPREGKQPVNAGNVIQIDGIQDESISKPYEGKKPEEIRQIVRNKSLNDLLDNSSSDTVPGQIGLFKIGLKSYFEAMTINDKRSMIAASLRYAPTFDFKDVPQEDIDSLRKDKMTKFCGAILKGTGPILQKMMQGLPRTIMGGFADALEDMKSKLPPINRKIVQAHFAKILQDNPNIKSISLVNSLGAATVGEALLCEIKCTQEGSDKLVKKNIVIKIMRHDAVERTRREAKIFEAAAKKLGGGMEKTWQGQYEKIMSELDFTNEAENIRKGAVYIPKAGEKNLHPVYMTCYNPTPVKLFQGIRPTRGMLAMEVAQGVSADFRIKEMRGELAQCFRTLYECDPATGNLLWNSDGAPIPRSDLKFLNVMTAYSEGNAMAGSIQNTQKMIMAMAMTWFQEAILGSGLYHGDMHAGNLMLNGMEPVLIDFGNITELKVREDGVDERKCILKMLVGAMLRSPSIFLEGFTALLSQEGKGEYTKNAAAAKVIMEEVMAKGQFSYDMCYRLQAAINELQKLNLEMPPQINGFIQSMTRLQNTLAEANTVVIQAQKILDKIINPDIPVNKTGNKLHDLDFIGELIDTFFEVEDQYNDANGDYLKIPRFADKVSACQHNESIIGDVRNYLEGKQTIQEVREAMHEMFDVCLLRHIECDAEHETNWVRNERIRTLSRIQELEKKLSADNVDLQQAKNEVAKSFAAAMTSYVTAIYSAIFYKSVNPLSNPGTFANVLVSLMFDSAEAADKVMVQFGNSWTEQLKLLAQINLLATELGFQAALGSTAVNNFISALQRDLLNGPGEKSYKMKA